MKLGKCIKNRLDHTIIRQLAGLIVNQFDQVDKTVVERSNFEEKSQRKERKIQIRSANEIHRFNNCYIMVYSKVKRKKTLKIISKVIYLNWVHAMHFCLNTLLL